MFESTGLLALLVNKVNGMYELINDLFYKELEKYDRCVIDYCIIGDDVPCRGLESHREAVLFAMLRVIERYFEEERDTERTFGYKIGGKMFPWSLDMGKAEAVHIDSDQLLSVPDILRTDINGNVFYASDWYPNDDNCGGQIPYWHAFLEPPHSCGYKPEDLRRLNAVLFPEGTDQLEVFEWSTDWSNYFDDGHEWWGAGCWSVYDPHLNRYVVIFASATD